MPRIPRNPSSGRRAYGKGGRDFGPPGPENIARFTRSLWRDDKDAAKRCDAIIDATFDVVGEVSDADLRAALYRRVLDRAYECLSGGSETRKD